jgi:alpha-beta hydrolase superfamily lysophospholipase
MQALHFGDPDRPLFGVYQPPLGPAPAQAAVLLCHPVGQEYGRAHWAVRRLANKLAMSGFHAFRFDYSCTGDSAGACADADVKQWVEDVRTAADELLAMSGVSALCVVGLRLGAALAVTALADGNPPVRDLVLWDPVVSGGAYLAELEAVHRAKTEALRAADVYPRREQENADELMGFPWTPAMRRAVEDINLLRAPAPATARVLLVASEERSDIAALLGRWTAAGAPVGCQVVPSDAHWNAYSVEMENTLLAAGALNAIDAHLAGRET